MPTRVHLAVSNKQTLLCAGEFAEPIELGRQSAADEGLFQPQRDRDGWRIPIARPEEQELSRRYARLELLPDGRLQLTNLSAHLPIPLTDAGELPPGVACTPTLPLRFSLGDKTIDVQAVVEPEPLQSLPTRTRLPGELGVSTTLLSSLAKPAARESEAETFVRWLQ
ncbi:MAG TPA: hypothetical protein VEL76_00420, partial [Gemmataceae bacterium]|nr:hypothetical protein [Gemmataceae bacterium]